MYINEYTLYVNEFTPFLDDLHTNQCTYKMHISMCFNIGKFQDELAHPNADGSLIVPSSTATSPDLPTACAFNRYCYIYMYVYIYIYVYVYKYIFYACMYALCKYITRTCTHAIFQDYVSQSLPCLCGFERWGITYSHIQGIGLRNLACTCFSHLYTCIRYMIIYMCAYIHT